MDTDGKHIKINPLLSPHTNGLSETWWETTSLITVVSATLLKVSEEHNLPALHPHHKEEVASLKTRCDDSAPRLF